MTQAFHTADRVYARCTAQRPAIHRAVQRASLNLARNENLARHVAELARWEGEGGAVRPRIPGVAAADEVPSMRSAMSRRPAFDSPVRTDLAAMRSGPPGKLAPAIASTGARSRNRGPVKPLRPDQNTSTHRMNNRRGIRSR
jgi:hypothetical protein